MGMSLIEGNEAVAWGGLTAGCRFFAGYPITPANTVLSTMLGILPPKGGIVLQCEDEIASIGTCLGASMAGLKVMTATSGPGLSLYSEHISFAIGSEIPIVIVDVQRLGPSTGSATRGADGDVQFMQWGSSGGLPVIVLAPVDVKDCFLLTVHAFNLAEQFRCPVFLASNKEIGMTKESVDVDSFGSFQILDRSSPPEGSRFLPFEVSNGKLVPDFLPVGGKTLVRQTSSTHGADGYITTDYREISRTQERLQKKLNGSISQFTFYESFLEEKAETLVITYGVTARAAKSVYKELKREGRPISLLILKTLWPVPEALIRESSSHSNRIIVCEMNLGQYVREVERVLCGKRVEFVGQMDGTLISPTQLKEVVKNG